MRIQNMFQEDIDRKINGVVKVDQDASDVLVQELKEYVITRELKKHFITFFTNYGDSFREKTADIGVWISGFFGSGKSHFLKMLSYLLENKEVQGERTVEIFRKKFSDDPAAFSLIEDAAKGRTDTILFNIDIEGSINKDKTAVLRVFAKMFYNYLGFYGENLKVAKLEQFIARKGKTEEFRRVFEEINGGTWLESRDAFAFFEDDIVATLRQVLGMSESAAQNWFNGTETVETSIAQLVLEIKEVVDAQPDDFRLLFMIDEVGQYVGGDTDLLINLQSLVEKIGSECEGKVWVVCTGQEAIDEIIKARENEFSRIQARFKTRLSLSSSSADEVIQKRILLKTPEAEQDLEQVFTVNDSVLRNLFSFSGAILDIKGYGSADEFARNFPFVPYQFILMQKVFAEIRKHGNSGKHLSGGERSMLSGFQEAAQRIEDKDEFALAPFYLFYDTVHTFLDSSIRRVIERCERAAADGNGIEPQDVDVLKLLYLVRYVDDVKATLDNIVILMADDIRLDKITMRGKVQSSLDRLFSQSYIGRTGDVYNFLTDEEQDIAREIRNTPVDSAAITQRISDLIFGDIYTTKKFRFGNKYDFPFDQMVDGMANGTLTGGMKLRFLTVATDPTEKQELRLMAGSGGQAIVVLAENPYYESLESAMKIRRYVMQRNVSQLPQSMQDIIRKHQDEAGRYEESAKENLKKAIVSAEFYVDGEHLSLKGSDPKSKIDQALEYLVTHVYSQLELIESFTDSDADIFSILKGEENRIAGTEPNRDAAAMVEKFLEMQYEIKHSTFLSDIQSRYQGIPYGWREIDIAAVVALLIHDQKVTIKYGGATVQPSDPRLPDMLRKKSEIGKTSISIKQAVPIQKIRAVRELLREYFDEMDVPEDEDGLIAHIVEKFTEEQRHYENLLGRYAGHNYPDKKLVVSSIEAVKGVLSQRKDNLALIDYLLNQEDDLFDLKEKMQNVEGFFKNQVGIFDAAVRLESDLRSDKDYIAEMPEINDALNKIRLIVMVEGGFAYSKIPTLSDLMATVREGHEKLLEAKRKELRGIIIDCTSAIHNKADLNPKANDIVRAADTFFTEKKKEIDETALVSLLESMATRLWARRDSALIQIEAAIAPPPPPKPKTVSENTSDADVPKYVEPFSYMKAQIFRGKIFRSEEEIELYLAEAERDLKERLAKHPQGIKIY